SKHSVWTYVKAVKRFFAWAKGRDQRVQAEAELPKLPRKLVEILSRDEIKLLEVKAGNERDALIVRILADTGLRVGELINLKIDSVIQRDRAAFLRVQGKGDKERLVPILPSLHRRIKRYAEGLREMETASRRLFLSRRRDPTSGDYKALTESGVQQMVREVADRARLSKRIHPHVFRHSAATFMLQRGMDSVLVAQVLGHESLQMIQRVYSHLTPLDAHKALASALSEDED
ncbi:MAG: tyrosine-type recombinase/integrase, partial [Candidatus Dormibacteraceae bacterium]